MIEIMSKRGIPKLINVNQIERVTQDLDHECKPIPSATILHLTGIDADGDANAVVIDKPIKDVIMAMKLSTKIDIFTL